MKWPGILEVLDFFSGLLLQTDVSGFRYFIHRLSPHREEAQLPEGPV